MGSRRMGHAHFSVSSNVVKNPPEVGGSFQKQRGWSLSLELNGGKLGEPEIVLVFSIAKPPSQDKLFDAETMDYDVVRFKWRPGLTTPEREWMVDDLEYAWVSEDPDNSRHRTVIDQIPADAEPHKKVFKLSRLFFLKFSSRGIISYGADSNLWRHLPEDVRENLDRLNMSCGMSTIVIHFVLQGKPSKEDCISGWLEPLKFQVNKHIKPWHPYRGEKGEVILDFLSMPTIAEVGNGMLVRRESNDPVKGFLTHAKRAYWDTHDEFTICIGMPAVRHAQWEREQTSHLERGHHFMFLQYASPSLKLASGLDAAQPMQNKCYGFFRLNLPESGTPLPLGTRLRVEFDDSTDAKPQTPLPRWEQWTGTVIENDVGCGETDTAFCAMLTRPRDFEIEPDENQGVFNDRFVRPSEDLFKVRIWIIHDTTAVARELAGVTRLGDPNWQPGTMNAARSALISHPDTRQNRVEDLTKSYPEDWKRFKTYIRDIKKFNIQQLAVIESLEQVKDGLVAIDGPPGTGKSSTITFVMVGALVADHKVLCVGPSHTAVDGLACKVDRELKNKDKFNLGDRVSPRLGKKQLFRLEVSSAELHAMAKIKEYADLSKSDPGKPLTAAEEDELAAIEEALNATIDNYIQYEDAKTVLDKAKDLDRRFDTLQETMGRVAELNAQKQSVVPLNMTMAWHLFPQSMKDRQQADDEFQAVKAAWMSPPKDLDAVLAATNAGEMTYEAGEASLRPAVSREVFDRMVLGEMTPKIQDADARNPSHQWDCQLRRYREKKGALSGEDRRNFMTAWQGIIKRVLENIDVIFTTCNNAGSDLLALGFSPDVVLCDEGAQVTCGGLSIAMTQAGKWKAMYVAGDIQQLRPRDTAWASDEFREFAQMSCLELLQLKGWNVFRLELQYRMAPRISKWPARRFYEGRLTDDKSLKLDNQWRRDFRDMSQRCYGIRGGSEYFIIDCQNGFSSLCKGSTSLANSAFAEVTAECIDHLLAMGMPAKDITVLTYYSGQKGVTVNKLKEFAKKKGRNWETDSVEVKTVDSYQGAENHIVIVDLTVSHFSHRASEVSAAPRDVEMPDANGNNANSADEADNESSMPFGPNVSSHVRDCGRLCTALTRAKDGLVVICNGSTILSTRRKPKQTMEKNTLSDMYLDAHERKLIHHDTRGYKNTVEYNQFTATWNDSKKRRHADQAEEDRKRFLSRGFGYFKQAKQSDPRTKQARAKDPTVPQYHTTKGFSRSAPLEVLDDPVETSQNLPASLDVSTRPGLDDPKERGKGRAANDGATAGRKRKLF